MNLTKKRLAELDAEARKYGYRAERWDRSSGVKFIPLAPGQSRYAFDYESALEVIVHLRLESEPK